MSRTTCHGCRAPSERILPVLEGDSQWGEVRYCEHCWSLVERGLGLARRGHTLQNPLALRLTRRDAQRYLRQGLLALRAQEGRPDGQGGCCQHCDAEARVLHTLLLRRPTGVVEELRVCRLCHWRLTRMEPSQARLIVQRERF